MKRNLGEILRNSLLLVLILTVVAGYLFTQSSNAQDAPKIQPGNYEISTKMRSSLDNALSKKTIEKCIQGNTINPESFLPDPERCKMINLTKSGNKSSFDITCMSPNGMTLTGHMEYTVSETSFSYKFNLESPHDGGTLKIDAEGDAVRKGECS